MNRLRGLILALIFSATSVSLAEAHAFVDHAQPLVGSTVQASPLEIKIWFTQEIKPNISSIEVLDAKGKNISSQAAKIDPANAAVMFVPVPRLAAGTYKVVWTAVCLQGHKTHGSFTFTVAP